MTTRLVPYTTPDFGCAGLGAIVGPRSRCRVYAPLRDWKRHYPTARRLAEQVKPHLHLRTRFLVLRLQIEHEVSVATAMRAVAIARQAAAPFLPTSRVAGTHAHARAHEETTP